MPLGFHVLSNQSLVHSGASQKDRWSYSPWLNVLMRLVIEGCFIAGLTASAAADDTNSTPAPTRQNDLAAGLEQTDNDRRYGDWELVCRPGTETQPKKLDRSTCRLQQAQAVNGGKDVVFLFNIALQGEQRVAIISTPLNVYLPAGLELKVDNGQTERVVFETCNISGCHAGFALTGNLLSALRKGNVLTVELQDTKATTIPLMVSLTGISAGIDALDAVNQ